MKSKSGVKNSIWPYIKLQMKLSMLPTTSQKKSSKAIGWCLKALVLILGLVLVYAFTNRMTHQTDLINGLTLPILVIVIVQIILLIYSISAQTKRLYKPGDLRIISTLPYTTFQRYLGEIIAIYLRMAIYSLVIVWPLLLVYCGAARIELDSLVYSTLLVHEPAKFVFTSLLTALIVPLFPFALSLVISVPFMLLNNYLKDKNKARLVIFIVLFCILLTAYGLVLNFMTDWYVHAKGNPEVMNGIANFLKGLNKPYDVCYFVSETWLGNKIYMNLPIYLAIVVAFTAAGIAITKPLYNKFCSQALIESDTKIKSVEVDNLNSYKAIFYKEFKQILRTPSYAYFYLGVAFSMPIMTYLEADIIKKLGSASVGNTAFFGFGLLIICIIMSLIGSYSANIVSREGKQFYITKVCPLSYRKQIFAKAIVNFIVSFIAWFLCIVVLAATSMTSSQYMTGLSWSGLGFLAGITLLFLVGVSFNGINIDIAFPKIDMLSTKINDRNIVIQLIIGLIITAILSMLAISVGTINQKAMLYVQLIILGLVLIYALVNFLVWFFTCEKKYAKIEIK